MPLAVATLHESAWETPRKPSRKLMDASRLALLFCLCFQSILATSLLFQQRMIKMMGKCGRKDKLDQNVHC